MEPNVLYSTDVGNKRICTVQGQSDDIIRYVGYLKNIVVCSQDVM